MGKEQQRQYNMLRSLNWPSLEERRRHSHLILLFKFLNGMIHIHIQYLPAQSPLKITRMNHNQKLMQLYAKTNQYHYSFLLKTIPDWNNLYVCVRMPEGSLGLK